MSNQLLTELERLNQAASAALEIANNAIAARDRAALVAKDSGATLAQIATALGLTRSGAQHLIERQRKQAS